MNRDCADILCDHRHAVDNAGLLVLPDGVSAGLAHFQQTVSAVLSHPGQDDTDSVTLDGIRNRAEQHIDRRAVSVDFLRLEKIDGVVTAKLDDLHVPIAARRDQYAAAFDDITVDSFFDLHLAETIEPLGMR